MISHIIRQATLLLIYCSLGAPATQTPQVYCRQLRRSVSLFDGCLCYIELIRLSSCYHNSLYFPSKW